MAASRAYASDSVNILIMGDDADRSMDGQAIVVARNSRVFDRALETVSDTLKQSGFVAFDERALEVSAGTALFDRGSDAELLRFARSVRRPAMDAALVMTVYTGARKLTYTTDVYVRLTARVIDVRTGASLANYEVTSPKGWRAPVNCEGECLVEAIGKNTKILAMDLGSVLARKIALHPPAQATAPGGERGASRTPEFELIFTGFTPDDISGVEEYLAAFKGYRTLRSAALVEDSAQYEYATDSDSRALEHNLRMMLDRLGIDGSVTFSEVDKTFRIDARAIP